MVVSRSKPLSIATTCARENADSKNTSNVRDHTTMIHFHTFLAVMGCLVALEWLHWWTFLMSLALLSSLALHFFAVTVAHASQSVSRDPSHEGTSKSAESSHLSRTG
jgi:hypothetical protein